MDINALKNCGTLGTCYKLMKTLPGRIDDMCKKLYEYSMLNDRYPEH